MRTRTKALVAALIILPALAFLFVGAGALALYVWVHMPHEQKVGFELAAGNAKLLTLAPDAGPVHVTIRADKNVTVLLIPPTDEAQFRANVERYTESSPYRCISNVTFGEAVCSHPWDGQSILVVTDDRGAKDAVAAGAAIFGVTKPAENLLAVNKVDLTISVARNAR